MSTTRVISTGSYLPGDPITNAQINDLAGPLPEQVLDGLETIQRHWMIDPLTGEHHVTNSEMAAFAARDALGCVDVAPSEVGVVVVSTASPEFHLPPVSSMVLEHLGMDQAVSVDVRSGCAGFVQALAIAESLLHFSAERYAFVIGSEAISPLVYPIYRGREPGQVRMRERIKAYTFGDGAGAVVLERQDLDDVNHGITGYAFRTVGGMKPPGMRIKGGSTDAPLHEQAERIPLVDLFVDIGNAGRLIPSMLINGLEHLLKASGIPASEPSIVVVPEGNAGYVTQKLFDGGALPDHWLALRSKIYENLDVVGATGSAAVPLAFHQAVSREKIRPGETALLLAIETSKWIYAGASLKWQ